MSLDFQYMTVVDSLAVSEIIDIADASPRTLKINGWNGYYTLQSIRINDVAINTFTVLSDKSVLVPLPTSLTTLPITDMLVELLSNSLSGTRRVRVLFTSTGNTKSVSGIL